jgi:multidrug efflux pump
MVKLSNLLSLKETVAPRELDHFNQQRAAIISANIAPGYTLGEAEQFFDQLAEQILPKNMQTDYEGESRELRESSSSLAVTFALALCFIYLVLCAQFESFVSPFIIMLTVPLAMTGALLALYLSGGTLNIYSQIALVTLVGLITKHGILIVDFANQAIERGATVIEATREACQLRLRPILMTTGAMVLGALPLAIAHGAGAESRKPIGWVIMGGLMVGTFFTLFVIPLVYATVREKSHKTLES